KMLGELPTEYTAKMGLLFGAETDADPYDWPQDDPEANPDGMPPGPAAMYRVWQRINGQIGIGIWDTAETSSWRNLATLNTPAVAADWWHSYELVVSPEGITFTRRMSDGTEHTVISDDVTFRGPYFFIEKEESITGSPPAPFRAKWRNVLYAAG